MTVAQRGTDSSGRPVRATPACWAAWDAACVALGFEPTIVQGGHMGSSGASASAGTHAGDAFDVRLWDRTSSERARMVDVFRAHGFAYWERYESQGFDLHAHMIPGPWASPAPQALDQWHDYLAGRNGLASNGADYHPRPNPIVTEPPQEEAMTPDDFERIRAIVREECVGAVDKALDAELNINDPGGDKRFREWSVRRALKALLVATKAVK